jgi:uncharacterized protein
MKHTILNKPAALLTAFSMVIMPAFPQQAKDESPDAASSNDIVKSFAVPVAGYDYVKREAMIPMRDGVKLYTVIMLPRGASHAPILLTRTPYNAAKRVIPPRQSAPARRLAAR